MAESERLGYANGNIMGYSIRNNRYRYTIWINKGFRSTVAFNEANVVGVELYDYIKDPLEKINVADQIEYLNESKNLKKSMLEYLASQVKPLNK